MSGIAAGQQRGSGTLEWLDVAVPAWGFTPLYTPLQLSSLLRCRLAKRLSGHELSFRAP